MLTEREFNKLLLQYAPYIRSLVLKSNYVGADGKEDAVQDIFMQALAKRRDFDPNKGAFPTWVWWLVRARLQQQSIRLRKRADINISQEYHDDGELMSRYEAVSPEGDPHACLELRETVDAICELHPRDAHVILQRAVGATLEEVGADLRVSNERVRQLHARGIKKLRRKLKPTTAGMAWAVA